jgi:hypothetical protein
VFEPDLLGYLFEPMSFYGKDVNNDLLIHLDQNKPRIVRILMRGKTPESIKMAPRLLHEILAMEHVGITVRGLTENQCGDDERSEIFKEILTQKVSSKQPHRVEFVFGFQPDYFEEVGEEVYVFSGDKSYSFGNLITSIGQETEMFGNGRFDFSLGWASDSGGAILFAQSLVESDQQST